MTILQSYDFVFLIPLRLAQGHSIVDVICQDFHLLPTDFGGSLSTTQANESAKVLFLFDIYEELEQSAVCAMKLKKIISNDLNAQANCVYYLSTWE